MRKSLALVAVPFLAVACTDPGQDLVAPSRSAPVGPSAGLGSLIGGPVTDGQTTAKVIPNEYIVVFKAPASGLPIPGRIAIAHRLGVTPRVAFSVIDGFAAHMTPAQAALLAQNPSVAYVEPDQVISIAEKQTDAPWGLDRIDQPLLPLSDTYVYPKQQGAGVHVYIIDTGIETSHPDFGGRASIGFDALGGTGQDCNGHGTHVAGTVGGKQFGVAKGVSLHAVRVLSCSGSGTTSGVIAGLDWVRTRFMAPAVANMSLGGGKSAALNDAVDRLTDAGVFVVAAAGNDNQDACDYSPASARGAYTVAASTVTDAKASFSSYGDCVEIYAPGVSITSAWLRGTQNTISGTSMAAPHVAGAAAIYRGSFGKASNDAVAKWLTVNATPNVITGNRGATPNRMLYIGGL